MEYIQHNPLPLPKAGERAHVASAIDTVFDWRYALDEKTLLALYEKGKAAAWNAADLDWSTDVDIERLARESQSDLFINNVLGPPRPLTREEAILFRLHINAFMLSQFLHGEQGALLASARIVQTVPWEEAKLYAANQAADEARHVEVYHRYLTEKLGLSYEVHPSLGVLLEDIVSDVRWDITYLGMQILVEGLALAAFGMMRLLLQAEPLIQDITARIMEDESRHVAFGVLSLQKLYAGGFTEGEMREREEFVIEAVHLLRERLLMEPVFERLGWDVKVWLPWMQENLTQRAFRQMMFSKIVPNLRRLGLLTPRVRAALEQMDLLRFEGGRDSIEEPGVTPPEELVQLLMQFLGNTPPATR
jgi:hypothetical protein